MILPQKWLNRNRNPQQVMVWDRMLAAMRRGQLSGDFEIGARLRKRVRQMFPSLLRAVSLPHDSTVIPRTGFVAAHKMGRPVIH